MLPFSGLTVETLESSKEAAVSMLTRAATLRQMVLDSIVESGSYGMTDEELQLSLKMKGNTERPRRWELFHLGKITQSSFTRRTLSGRSAVVWINNDFKA